jgi:outer membrane scaffolding protein for murein synthesis (MipA/OmpV family)
VQAVGRAASGELWRIRIDNSMIGHIQTVIIIVRRLGSLAIVLCLCAPRVAWCQTPSPLQEWQYPGGIMLEQIFEPSMPDWRFVLGAAVASEPLYDGARPYRVEPAPVIDIRYRDIAFASVGEGLGVNILRSGNCRAGTALGYDLGRPVSDAPAHLHGMGDIPAAPFIKLFASCVISKSLPIVFRTDVRRLLGGTGGLLGDVQAYMPLPGSSEKLFMLAGPSITFSNRQYTQKAFGVSAAQASASGYPVYDAHGGWSAAGLGFSVTRFITPRWLVNADVAVNRLVGSASNSPITQSSFQGAAELTAAYRW